MPQALRKCMICGRAVPANLWTCGPCAREHGLEGPFKGWPTWAKELANLQQQERRAERLAGDDTNLESAAARATDSRDGSRLRTRPHSEWSAARQVPSGPYADPADNLAYRKSHGIEAPDVPGPGPDWYIDPAPLPLEMALSTESIDAMMARLSERERAAIEAAADGWPHDEIGALLGISPGAVAALLARARAKLTRQNGP